MRCKIARTQKLMWHNIMRLTKSQKISVLHYSIDMLSQSHIPGNYHSLKVNLKG